MSNFFSVEMDDISTQKLSVCQNNVIKNTPMKTKTEFLQFLNEKTNLQREGKCVSDESILHILKVCSVNADPKDNDIVQKVSTLCTNLLAKNVTLSSIDAEVTWILTALKNTIKNQAADLIKFLNILLLRAKRINENIIFSILNNDDIKLLLASSNTNPALCNLITKCLQNTKDINILLSLLILKISSSEIILRILKHLCHVLEENHDYLSNDTTSRALSIALHFISYDNFTVSQTVPLQLHPITFPISATEINKKNTNEKKKVFCKPLEEVVTFDCLPSSGDARWDESHAVVTFIHYAAIYLMLLVIRLTEPSVLFGYWSYLIFPGSPSLRQCIKFNPSWNVRLTGLIVLDELILHARPFLAHSENPRTVITSFTTFSETIGATLIKLHEDLIGILKITHLPIVHQTLKCLSTLVQCTPYNRISNQLLESITGSIRPSIEHSDKVIRSEAFNVMQSIVSSEPPVSELTPKFEWMLSAVIGHFSSIEPVPATTINECLQLISSFSKNYFELFAERLEDVGTILAKCFSYHCVHVRFQTGRTFETVSDAINCYVNNENSKRIISINECAVFWQSLISALIICLQDEHAPLRMVGCDCLGNIDAKIFQALPRKTQILIITVLFTCIKDVEPGVRSSGIRALARGILEAGRIDDPGFVADVAQACITTMFDSVTNVRIKAAWALANLGDALLLNRIEDACDDLPDKIYLELYNIALSGAQDNDKVKCNITRAIGNLLSLITKHQIQQNEFKLVVEKSIKALVNHASAVRDMKIKWNACYAIGNMLKNENVYSLQKTWENDIFSILIKLSTESRNFKVRTNAVLALSAPKKRWHYDSYWLPAWNGLMQVIDSSQHIDDFKEYKHRDTLIEQTCLTIAHLASVAYHDDMMSTNSLSLHADIVKRHVIRCHEQLIPERTKTFLSAVTNATLLIDSGKLTQQQKQTVMMIKDIFSECNDDNIIT